MASTEDKKFTDIACRKIESAIAAIRNLGLPADLETEVCYKIRVYPGWYHIAAKEYYSKQEEARLAGTCTNCEE